MYETNNYNLNQQTRENISQPREGKAKWIIMISLLIIVSAVIFITFTNSKKEDYNEQVIEEELKEYSWSGLYTNGNDYVKIYQIDENKIYFDINTEESRAYATAKINNNKAEGKIYATYYFEINGDKLQVKTTDEYMYDATYTKTGEYSKKDIYIDNFGDPKYLDTKVNGIFYSEKEDTTITVYQTASDKAHLHIKFGDESYIRDVTVINKKIKFHEKLHESETNIEITFSNDELELTINNNGNEILPRSLSGSYSKTKSITMNDLLEDRLK